MQHATVSQTTGSSFWSCITGLPGRSNRYPPNKTGSLTLLRVSWTLETLASIVISRGFIGFPVNCRSAPSWASCFVFPFVCFGWKPSPSFSSDAPAKNECSVTPKIWKYDELFCIKAPRPWKQQLFYRCLQTKFPAPPKKHVLKCWLESNKKLWNKMTYWWHWEFGLWIYILRPQDFSHHRWPQQFGVTFDQSQAL